MKLLNNQSLTRLSNDANHYLLLANVAKDADLMLEEAIKHLKTAKTTILLIKADNGTIGIDKIRQHKKQLSLRHSDDDRLIIAIYQGQQMTTEAQNSLLKILEETPTGVKILMSSSLRGNLLETITSRLSQINYEPPKLDDLQPAEAAIYKASGYSYSQLMAYQKSNLDSLDQAKQWLSDTKTARLGIISSIKDNQSATELIEAVLMVLYSLLAISASKQDKKQLKSVLDSIDLAMLSLSRIQNGGNLRLNLTQLALGL